MLYIPIRRDKAEGLSSAIYQLTRPPTSRSQADISSHYCEWIEHPTRSDVALLAMPETDTIPLHVGADAELLKSILGEFVPNEITADEMITLEQAIITLAGQTVPVYSLVPESWKPYVMTLEQARQAGWLPEDDAT